MKNIKTDTATRIDVPLTVKEMFLLTQLLGRESIERGQLTSRNSDWTKECDDLFHKINNIKKDFVISKLN